MNTQSINWNLSGLAGHDDHGNEISVRELVMAYEGQQQLLEIVNMPDSMRDALTRQAAENYRLKVRDESLQRQIGDLKAALDNANTRVSNLLSEHAEIQNDAALDALAKYANPTNWANPRNQHGELQTDQRSVFIKGFHGYELAASVLQHTTEQAA